MLWFGLKNRVDELEAHAFNLELVLKHLVTATGNQIVLGKYADLPDKEYLYNLEVVKTKKHETKTAPTEGEE